MRESPRRNAGRARPGATGRIPGRRPAPGRHAPSAAARDSDATGPARRRPPPPRPRRRHLSGGLPSTARHAARPVCCRRPVCRSPGNSRSARRVHVHVQAIARIPAWRLHAAGGRDLPLRLGAWFLSCTSKPSGRRPMHGPRSFCRQRSSKWPRSTFSRRAQWRSHRGKTARHRPPVPVVAGRQAAARLARLTDRRRGARPEGVVQRRTARYRPDVVDILRSVHDVGVSVRLSGLPTRPGRDRAAPPAADMPECADRHAVTRRETRQTPSLPSKTGEGHFLRRRPTVGLTR